MLLSVSFNGLTPKSAPGGGGRSHLAEPCRYKATHFRTYRECQLGGIYLPKKPAMPPG